MITLDQLKPFCSTDVTRSWLMDPFTDGRFTFATNGWIIIRVPGWVEGARLSTAPGRQISTAAQAREIIQPCADLAASAFRPFPQPSANPVPQLVPCEYCEGEGCDECDMSGKYDQAKPAYDAIFGSVFNVQFLNLIWRLDQEVVGGVGCAPSLERDKDYPNARKLLVRCLAEPLCIVLMPMRWTVAECPNLKAQHFSQ
jgi:hypothetical protein